MQYDTIVQALIGGALIGLGAISLMLFNGRIAGISGITAGAMTDRIKGGAWRIAFLAGLVVAPLITSAAQFSLPQSIDLSLTQLVVGGLLVGIGTQLGSGCTSGHGICGLARFSTRSVIATALFMATAALTVAVTRHML
ncbi:YeeE/YedE family protein [Alteromonas halophila]|uniref:Membrane protein n=1 Tax=Alteromonas halophila TaxID=516698 RepID=A0A918JLW9_9ALTE|nr:YeeE/YedE family protein [Alteromonas halophila]GGW88744.1 membrane protein [Alteromonas halophila]